MEHFTLLYYLLFFTAGCVSVGMALLTYPQHRKEVIHYSFSKGM